MNIQDSSPQTAEIPRVHNHTGKNKFLWHALHELLTYFPSWQKMLGRQSKYRTFTGKLFSVLQNGRKDIPSAFLEQ